MAKNFGVDTDLTIGTSNIPVRQGSGDNIGEAVAAGATAVGKLASAFAAAEDPLTKAGKTLTHNLEGLSRQLQEGIITSTEYTKRKQKNITGLRVKLGGETGAGKFLEDVAKNYEVSEKLSIDGKSIQTIDNVTGEVIASKPVVGDGDIDSMIFDEQMGSLQDIEINAPNFSQQMDKLFTDPLQAGEVDLTDSSEFAASVNEMFEAPEAVMKRFSTIANTRSGTILDEAKLDANKNILNSVIEAQNVFSSSKFMDILASKKNAVSAENLLNAFDAFTNDYTMALRELNVRAVDIDMRDIAKNFKDTRDRLEEMYKTAELGDLGEVAKLGRRLTLENETKKQQIINDTPDYLKRADQFAEGMKAINQSNEMYNTLMRKKKQRTLTPYEKAHLSTLNSIQNFGLNNETGSRYEKAIRGQSFSTEGDIENLKEYIESVWNDPATLLFRPKIIEEVEKKLEDLEALAVSKPKIRDEITDLDELIANWRASLDEGKAEVENDAKITGVGSGDWFGITEEISKMFGGTQ